MEQDYIKWIRSKVGHEKIFINYAMGFILNDQGQVLVNRRADSGLWGFIGGAVELGETFEQAFAREVKEEVGLKELEFIKQLGTYTILDFVYPNGDRVQPVEVVFIVKAKEEIDLTYRDEETLDIRWVDPRNLGVELFNKNHFGMLGDFIKWLDEHPEYDASKE